MITVSRLGHATVLVEAGGLRCLMDPVLVEPFENDCNRFEPPVRIDLAGLRASVNLIVLSHEHGDHFCIRSLDLLDRRCTVVVPAACGLADRALRALGFRNVVKIVPGQTIPAHGGELTFTPSDVAFPEVGVLFAYAGASVWNCVDSEIGERAHAVVDRQTRRVDLMLANYQALAEAELAQDGLGGPFPIDVYRKRLQAVVDTAPRAVVPGSCGYRYATEEWLNQRGFPVDEADFMADVRALLPTTRTMSLPHGAAVDTDGLTVREDAVPFVRAGTADPSRLAWRPDRGVPPLRDDDPFKHGADHLRVLVAESLGESFLGALASPALGRWRRRLAAAGVVWQLDVVYPDGAVEERWLDFAEAAPAWRYRAPRPPRLVTSICASTLFGLTCGEATPYRALFTRRVVVKLYTTTKTGIEQVGSVADEPIARVLFPGANLRFVDAELARLGYRPA